MSYFINAITEHYADFQGRVRRKHFWMFSLFNGMFVIAALILDNVLGTSFEFGAGQGWIYWLVVLGTFLPGLALYVRRLHDVGKSAWFLLVYFIPIAGAIWMLVLLCRDSQPGTNQYGANPKTADVMTDNTAAPVGIPLPSRESSARFCRACGAPRIEGAAFCATCGERM